MLDSRKESIFAKIKKKIKCSLKKIKSLKLKKPLIIISAIFGALVLVYISGIIYFSYNFQYNTKINNIDVSFTTPKAIEDTIEKNINNYKMKIVTISGKSEFINAKDIDLLYENDDSVENLLKEQNIFKWPLMFISKFDDKFHTKVSLNKTKLDKKIDSFDFMNTQNMEEPQNAEICYNEQDVSFEVKKEILGSKINNKIYSKIYTAIINIEETINLYKSGCYVEPEVTVKNKDLEEQCNKYNKYCNKILTYKLNNSEKKISGEMFLSFVEDRNAKELVYNDESIKTWLKSFGNEIDTIGSTRTFTSVDGAQYTVTGGTYGFELDEKAELEEIKRFINSDSKEETREPMHTAKSANFANKGEADWGNTYAEVNLTKQHMYFVKDGNLVFETDIVSGLPVPKKETPCGVFSCLEKKQNKVLKGEIGPDGHPEYETPVAYWMRITWSGVGFHTATWQPSFGGNRYTYAGSHGCVNMSYNDSQTLYGIIEVGNPIIIHK